MRVVLFSTCIALFSITPGLAEKPSAPSAPSPSEAAESAKAEGEALILDGVPSPSSELRSAMYPFLNIRSASLASLADDGRSMLVLTRFGETHQLHHVKAPLGARTQVTFSREPISFGALVPGASRSILFMSDVGGNERSQIYRVDLEAGHLTVLTDGISRHSPFVWSRDGDRIAFTSNARNGRDMDVYVSDGRHRESLRRIAEVSGYFVVLDWSRDGTKILVQDQVSIQDTRLYVVAVQDGSMVRVSPPDPPAGYRRAIFGFDANTIYVAADRDREFVELFEVHLAATTERAISLSRHVPWNVEGIALSPSGRTLAFTTNEDGYSVLRFIDTKTRTQHIAKEIPRGVITTLTFARKSEVLGFTLTSATRAPDAYTMDPARRTLTRWTESEVGGLNPERFVEPALTYYPSFDDRKIPAYYFKPKRSGTGPFPTLISLHGGPEEQARPWFSSLTQYFVAEAGFAILVPNVRGSDGYGKTFLSLDNGTLRENSVRDVGALLDWIKTRPELDASRVAVFGGSYGGYMVLSSLIHYGDRIAAGADMVGISNFVTFLEKTSEYRRDLRRAEYGDERDPMMREHLLRISPLHHVDEITSALFVAQGANDPRVPLAESEQIVKAVRSRGHDVWYMLAKNEGHGFQKKANRDAFNEILAMFFAKHIGSR